MTPRSPRGTPGAQRWTCWSPSVWPSADPAATALVPAARAPRPGRSPGRRSARSVLPPTPPGRELASRIACDLHGVASELVAVDLAPGREDGYDLTDWLLEHPVALTLERLPRLV
jgi:hypothetical protein